MSGLISIADYARHRGVSDAAVHQAIKAGRVDVIEVDGRRLLHPDLADHQWRERTQYSKARPKRSSSPATRPAEESLPASTLPYAASLASAPPGSPDEPSDPDYFSARTRRELALAQLAELELARTAGRQVDRERVAAVAMRIGRLLRDTVLGLPTPLAPVLAEMTDPLAVETRLTEALRAALSDVARLSTQDLEALLGEAPR